MSSMQAVSRAPVSLADSDDELAVAVTAGQGLVAAARALRLSLCTVEAWRGDRGRVGCLCRAAEELRVAVQLVDGVMSPLIRRGARDVRVGDAAECPVSGVTRLLGRTARVLQRLARGSLPHGRPGPVSGLPDPQTRTQLRTAWENTFHALVRLRAVEEAQTWFADSAVDPWLLLVAEAPLRATCGACDGDDGGESRAGWAEVIPIDRATRRGARRGAERE